MYGCGCAAGTQEARDLPTAPARWGLPRTTAAGWFSFLRFEVRSASRRGARREADLHPRDREIAMKCFRCGTQERERFSPSAQKTAESPGKHKSSQFCKACRREYFADYRARHRSEIAEKAREYCRRPEVKARNLECTKRYYWKHRDKIRWRRVVRRFLSCPRRYKVAPMHTSAPPDLFKRDVKKPYWMRGGAAL